MDRRRFLTAVTAAVGGFALDVDKLLWVPGQRTYFDIVPQRISPEAAARIRAHWEEAYYGRPILAVEVAYARGSIEAETYRFTLPTNYYEAFLSDAIANIERQLQV